MSLSKLGCQGKRRTCCKTALANQFYWCKLLSLTRARTVHTKVILCRGGLRHSDSFRGKRKYFKMLSRRELGLCAHLTSCFRSRWIPQTRCLIIPCHRESPVLQWSGRLVQELCFGSSSNIPVPSTIMFLQDLPKGFPRGEGERAAQLLISCC